MQLLETQFLRQHRDVRRSTESFRTNTSPVLCRELTWMGHWRTQSMEIFVLSRSMLACKWNASSFRWHCVARDWSENPVNYGQMQKQKWALADKEYAVEDENEEALEHTLSNAHLDDEQQEREELTVKPGNNFKSAREEMIERKKQQADTRGKMFTWVEINGTHRWWRTSVF